MQKLHFFHDCLCPETRAALGTGEAAEPYVCVGQRDAEPPGHAGEPLHQPADRGAADGVKHSRPALPHAHVQELREGTQGRQKHTHTHTHLFF